MIDTAIIHLKCVSAKIKRLNKSTRDQRILGVF